MVIILHVYAFGVFGATYWIDSLNYVRLAHALRTSGGLTAFYSSNGYWFCSHIEPGIPIWWIIASQFSMSWQWPIVALCQHTLAAATQYFAFGTADHYWPTRWHLLPCALLGLLPFYQSFHNALLTESIAGSLLLFAVTLALRLVMNPVFQRSHFAMLLLALVFVTQVRVYYGPLLALLIVVVLWQKQLLWSRFSVLFLFTAITANLLFPIYRASQTGEFFLPHVGGLDHLVVSSLADPNPGAAVAQTWRRVSLPAELPSSVILNSGLSWVQAERLGSYWRTIGFTREQVDRQAQEIATVYQYDHHFLVRQRFALAMTAVGFVSPLMCGDTNKLLTAGYSAPAYARHCLDDGYIWHSRISKSDYRATFNLFFGRANSEDQGIPGADAARIALDSAWKSYLSKLPLRFRDPAYLGSVLPDIWAAVGLISMAVVLFGSRPLGLVLFACPVLHFAVLAFPPLGGLRYGYALFSIYFLSCSIAGGMFISNWNKAVFSGVNRVPPM